MHQAHIAVQHRCEHLAGDLGVAMGNGHRMLLMQHDEHLRLRIAQVIDQAVMQAAEAGAGIEQHIGDAQRPQQFGNHIAAPDRAAALRGDGYVAARPGVLIGAHGLSPI